MLYDKNISPNRNEACASCHMPYAGFSGPIPSVNLTMIAYPGTAHFRAGKRTAQRHPYSPFFPVLQYNQVQGLFFGGNFWDSRATGYKLRVPDAEQAQGPPVDTQEMGFPDTACIAFRLSAAVYRPLFEEVWGKGSFDIKFPRDTEKICDTPGGAAVFNGSTTPIPLSPEDRTRANTVYDRWAQSIDSFEQSVQVSAFSSKFDAFLAGKYKLTSDEMAGLKLFDGKGNCNSCHLDGRGTALKSGQMDTSSAAMVNPLFTCFGSANEGLPLNPQRRLLLPDEAGFLRVHCQSLRLRLPRLGTRNLPPKRIRFRPQPEPELEAICADCRRANASSYIARRGLDPAAMPHHRSPRSLLPEGVLSQRIPEELEAGRTFLQHARQVCVPRYFRTLSSGNDRESRLLAYARGAEQYRYDQRQSRLDG